MNTPMFSVDETEVEDDAGRYAPDERTQMRERLGMRVVYTGETAETNGHAHNGQTASQQQFSYERHKRDYLKEGWEHEDRINQIFAGSEQAMPNTPQEAIALVRDRFGCVFKKLPEALRRDPQVILAATVESSGHELSYVPQDAVEQLPPEFYITAMQAGARGWILNTPGVSDEVKRHHDVQILAVNQHPSFVEYCIDPSEEVMQRSQEVRAEMDRALHPDAQQD